MEAVAYHAAKFDTALVFLMKSFLTELLTAYRISIHVNQNKKYIVSKTLQLSAPLPSNSKSCYLLVPLLISCLNLDCNLFRAATMCVYISVKYLADCGCPKIINYEVGYT